MRFREGDTVRISKQSWRYGNTKCDPKDTNGKITSIYPYIHHSIEVKWDNGMFNLYSENDLKLYGRDNSV